MSSLGYEDGLKSLWGDNALILLRDYLKSGEIVEYQVKRMAEKMGVKVVYNQNRLSVDLRENFERMLEEWYDQRLFDLESRNAKDILLDVLEYSNCSKKIVSRIEEAFISPSSSQHKAKISLSENGRLWKNDSN